ncbi:MAG: N-6 DNA methylase [Verrucomicrobia bacterium]|jgi:type I restriction enzyme M protein|nr:N-6 DNA methylase [Verrucomicrobiota bacterium]
MTGSAYGQLEKLESDLWEAADQLRANSKLTSSEYCMPVLGVIFLRHATNRFAAAHADIEAERAAGQMKRKPRPADYVRRRALYLPEVARYDYILGQSKDKPLPKLLNDAMKAIEESFEPLMNVLPKDYHIFTDQTVLEELLKIFNREAIKTASGDIFGRIYEFFLMKFAIDKAMDNGEFFTPPSIVQTIVNVIEPDHGKVADIACGSGGMFVQSSYFIESEGEDTAKRVTFYGHEKTASTIKLAKMNLAVHGLEGKIAEANTFYEDPFTLVGQCDFVMANPPFNVDLVDAKKAEADKKRLPFGLPGVNKAGKVSNGNYLWISYFHSYLKDAGRAGFVMSSQASSAGRDEQTVRRKIVESGAVDAMIAIRSNFFYTRSVPCELWFFDRGKPTERLDKVLMLDARNVFRKVTRKVNDFSPEQLANLSSIVWLYRGQSERFVGLAHQHLKNAIAEAGAIATAVSAFKAGCDALVDATAAYEKSLPKKSPLHALIKERSDAEKQCFLSASALTAAITKHWRKPPKPTLAAVKKATSGMEELASSCRDLVKDVDLLSKLAVRFLDIAEKENGARDSDAWETRTIARLKRDLNAIRVDAVDQLKTTAYFHRHAHWLLSRFPDAKLVDVPGLVKLVDRAEIEAADWSLTPGRYVGVAPPEVDEDFDFEQTMRDIHIELAGLNKEAVKLAKKIQTNFTELGI